MEGRARGHGVIETGKGKYPYFGWGEEIASGEGRGGVGRW